MKNLLLALIVSFTSSGCIAYFTKDNSAVKMKIIGISVYPFNGVRAGYFEHVINCGH